MTRQVAQPATIDAYFADGTSGSGAVAHDRRLVYSPLPSRPPVRWPGGKRVAVWVAPNVEHYDYLPPTRWRGAERVQAPDVQHYAHRDYGNRVGFWRMLAAMDRYDIPATVSLSTSVLEEWGPVREAMLERGWEIMSHGLYNTRTLYGFSPAEEREFYEVTQALAVKYTGRPMKGMLGPAVSGTDDTVELMAAAGFSYHADWVHDDQPRPLREASGARIVSVPYTFTLNDVPLMFAKHYSGEQFADLVRRQLRRLVRDGADGQGRVMCVALHPFVAGQPHLRGPLEEIFAELRGSDDVWLTTAEQITDHYLTHHYDAHLASARTLQEQT